MAELSKITSEKKSRSASAFSQKARVVVGRKVKIKERIKLNACENDCMFGKQREMLTE